MKKSRKNTKAEIRAIRARETRRRIKEMATALITTVFGG